MLAEIELGRVALFLACLGFLAFVSRAAFQNDSWRAAPTELLAFMAFSICVVALDLGAGAFGPSLSEESLQYTGWVGSMIYIFGAIVGWTVCTKRKNSSRIVLLAYLGVFAVGHAIEFWVRGGDPNDTNPYLRVSPYRPIWTVGIPIVWMLLLLSPRVKRYCTGTSAVAT